MRSHDAEGRGVRLLDFAVLRVAAWPIGLLDEFDAEQLATAASRLLAMTAGIEARSTALVAAIYQAVPRIPDRDVRAHLLSVKRAVHAGADVLRRPSPAIAAQLWALEPELAVAVEREIVARLELAAGRRSFDALFGAELERQRLALHRVTAAASFRRALEIGNPPLAARWKPVSAAAGLSDRARARRLEASIFHTLMRAIGRPAPQGAWAGVAPVRPTERDPGEQSRLSVDPVPTRRSVNVDLAPFAATLAALRRLPRYQTSSLRLNPTIRDVPGGWRYERVTADGLNWESVPNDHWCTALVASYRDGLPRPAEQVVLDLVGTDNAPRAAVDQAVRKLLDLDVLRVDLSLATAPETVWAALDAVVPALLPDDRRRWTAAVGRIREVCEQLEREFDDLDPDEVGEMRRVVEAEIDGLWRWAGVWGKLHRPAVHLDTTVSFDVRWNGAARRHFQNAVNEVLLFHEGDGAAERYRRVSLNGVVAAVAAAQDKRLPDLADDTGLRRRAPTGDDIDTHEAIFARFTDAPSPEVAAHCRQWERRLDPVHALDRVTIGMEPHRDFPRAGPEGAFVLSSLNATGAVAEWGRPQAGMFVARLAAVLAAGDDDFPLVAELRRRAGALRDQGIVAAEIVGTDPASPNTAVQPRIIPRRLNPHGPRDGPSNDLRLELDPESLRPWLIGADGERIFPSYHSPAAIGGVDPCSWLLFRLAMGHGWEFASFGFPALARERNSWRHLPRLVLPGGTVLSAERWTIPAETVRAIRARDECGRYLAWRSEAERLGLPRLARIRWNPNPGAPTVLMRTDSPLALGALFLRLPMDCPRLVITEIPGGLEANCIRAPDGSHHFAELAVSWYDDSYWEAAVGGQGVADAV